MSTRSSRVAGLVVSLVTIMMTVLAVAEDRADPVVQYYWNKARAAFGAADPAAASLAYILSGKTYYKHVDSNGEIVRIDSAVVDYYCRGDIVDSQTVISGSNSRFPELDLTFTNVFDIDYHCYLFPNDTGGVDLALGLDTDSGDTNPDGLIVIDRNRCLPRWLYLYYPAKKGFRRFTRSFRFTEVDGYVFPDSIWEVASRPGILLNEYYRLETAITGIELCR